MRSLPLFLPFLVASCAGSENNPLDNPDAARAIDAAPADAADDGDFEPVAPDMVRVPAGPFIMGCDGCGDDLSPGDDERPAHMVEMSTFDIDRTEVSQSAYAACVTAGACTEPGDNYSPQTTPDLPAVRVTWQQAVDFCAHLGRRLPSEAEWEKAARGDDGRRFPWGNDEVEDCARANTGGCNVGVRPVGDLSAGASPYGALNMAGNVWEWTADYYAADAYGDHDGPNPTGPESGSSRAIRGGSHGNLLTLARTTNRSDAYNPDFGGSGLGFRCAQSPVVIE